MEKIIWVVGNNRTEMIEAQRQINSTGSMRAFCLLSYEAVEKAAVSQTKDKYSRISTPSLIVVDYTMAEQEEFRSLSYLKKQESLAGVPIFFMVENRSQETDEICYKKGAVVVLRKPFSQTDILRMERIAWQHEVTKNYEKMLQKQASDLQAAREILRLNEQLKSRNELLHQIFGRYFSDDLVQDIMERPQGSAIGGDKRELTVLMSDLRGFTSLSEELEPDAVTDVLNLYFGKMAEVISQYHGTIIEFLGDGILAVFGAPLCTEEQTEEAIAAAISMQNRMGEVNAYCAKHKYPPLEMGIGIHRGEAFVGNVGSEKMMRYNVIGRVVNECSRIESYSVGGQILISNDALAAVSCPVEVHNEMEITAKGIHKTITASEIISIGGDYQLLIANVEFDALSQVEEWICFELYPIDGKVIQGAPLPARLTQFSCKRAVVELEDFQADLKVYSDVQISAIGKDGTSLFSGVYAKVVRRQFDRVTLHFTHINRSFQKFSGQDQTEEWNQNLKQG